MQVIFSNMPLPTYVTKTLFLAGPSIRKKECIDWRHEALAALRGQGYDGTVFVPIPEGVFFGKNDLTPSGYDDQVDWEFNARARADIVMFWVPRNIEKQTLGLTTNAEFGLDLPLGRVVYGRPDNADHYRYLDHLAREAKIPIHNDLGETIKTALSHLQDYHRYKGETCVPAQIWKQKGFQDWLELQKVRGNRLDYAKVVTVFPAVTGRAPYMFAMKVHVHVADEGRSKTNEIILGRPDISTIVPYYNDGHGETYFLMVREFRSSVRNGHGFVYEFPGGSSNDTSILPFTNAVKELEEETGLSVDSARVVMVDDRQLASTFSIHKAFLCKVQMTREEFEQMEAASAEGKGILGEDGSELTYVKVVKKSKLMNYPIDFSTLGMIYACGL